MATQQELVIAKLGAVDNTQAAFNSVQNNIQRTAKQSKALNGQLRMMRGGFGQVGHQIQDIAVQLQMGTNAMIVFGQQGSQIASLFGPKGALIGAVLAVGAAIGVSLLNKTEAAKVSLKDLGDEARASANEFNGLAGAMRDAAAAKIEGQFDSLLNRVLDLKSGLSAAEAAAQLAANGNVVGGKTAREWQAEIVRLNGEIEANEALLSTVSDRLAGTSKSTEEFITSLEREAAILGMTERQIALYDAAQKGATEADLERINSLYQKIEAFNREQAAEGLAMKARLAALKTLHNVNDAEMEAIKRVKEAKEKAFEEDRNREELDRAARLAATDNLIANANRELDAIVAAEKKKQAVQKQTMQNQNLLISNAQQMTSSIISSMDQQSGAYKALFALQQALAIAQTIVQYEVAIAQAKGQLGIFGMPMEALLRAQQVASVAIIAGQTIAGFEGGGIIPNGPRAGGVDGRGGRMAIVHPNEKITDMRRGGGDNKPVNISFNIQANDAQGFDELLVKRRALIVNMVNKAVNNSGRRSLT